MLTGWDVLLESRPVGERVVVLDDDGSRYAAGVTEVLLDARQAASSSSAAGPRSSPATLTTLDMAARLRPPARQGARVPAELVGERRSRATASRSSTCTRAPQTRSRASTRSCSPPGRRRTTSSTSRSRATVENLHRIGDCLAPRKLDHAIYEGELAGRELWSPEERYIYEGELERWEEATVAAGA